jgi:hypothetical protein
MSRLVLASFTFHRVASTVQVVLAVAAYWRTCPVFGIGGYEGCGDTLSGVAIVQLSARLEESLYTCLRRVRFGRRSLVQSDDRIGGPSTLLNGMQVIPKSQHEEESALLRCKIKELNENTVRLIAEAEKLIQETKQLSERIKSFENPSTKPKWPPARAERRLA